jgi:hypothetical protein
MLAGSLTAIGTWWWNRRSGGYNGSRPNWWKLIPCALLGLSGLFGAMRSLLNFRAASIQSLVFFTAYGILGLYLFVGEVAWFRKGRILAPQPSMANPWKIFVCFAFAASGVDGMLRPMRGPFQPSNPDQVAGALTVSAIICLLAAFGMAWEIHRLYRHAKSLK